MRWTLAVLLALAGCFGGDDGATTTGTTTAGTTTTSWLTVQSNESTFVATCACEGAAGAQEASWQSDGTATLRGGLDGHQGGTVTVWVTHAGAVVHEVTLDGDRSLTGTVEGPAGTWDVRVVADAFTGAFTYRLS